MHRDDFDHIKEYTEMCDKHDAEAVDEYMELHDKLDNFEESYCGVWDSEEAFGRELFMYDYTMGTNNNVFRNICPSQSSLPPMAFPARKGSSSTSI